MELLARYSKHRRELDKVAHLLDEPGRRGPKPKRPRQNQVHLNPEKQAELLQRYLSGERAFELAKEFGVHRGTVAKILTRNGLRRPRSMTPDKISTAVELYGRGWSCAQIGAELGRNPGTIWRALKVAGVQFRDEHGRER